MSVISPLFGLPPRAFVPGEGTEPYRGVGTIMLFGIAGSTMVTVTFLPTVTVWTPTWGRAAGAQHTPTTAPPGVR